MGLRHERGYRSTVRIVLRYGGYLWGLTSPSSDIPSSSISQFLSSVGLPPRFYDHLYPLELIKSQKQRYEPLKDALLYSTKSYSHMRSRPSECNFFICTQPEGSFFECGHITLIAVSLDALQAIRQQFSDRSSVSTSPRWFIASFSIPSSLGSLRFRSIGSDYGMCILCDSGRDSFTNIYSFTINYDTETTICRKEKVTHPTRS